VRRSNYLQKKKKIHNDEAHWLLSKFRWSSSFPHLPLNPTPPQEEILPREAGMGHQTGRWKERVSGKEPDMEDESRK
jgi:hypothetical protein